MGKVEHMLHRSCAKLHAVAKIARLQKNVKIVLRKIAIFWGGG